MKRILARTGMAVGSIALVATGALATAGPANAALSDCPSGALCAYLGVNGSGDPGVVYADNSNLLQYNKFNNAESLYNNGNSCNVRIYSGLGYTGSSYVLARGYYNGSLANTVWWHNVASNDWCV
ncbi:peptidase inhibitor family I36 protein [Streptomyces sp. NPDC002588]|uniref:peptidase inhibitor family I36 protein n=1 Tax=Streptomyces sp. NPDC002588 TaxID=3154419 RepID=UPI003321A753